MKIEEIEKRVAGKRIHSLEVFMGKTFVGTEIHGSIACERNKKDDSLLDFGNPYTIVTIDPTTVECATVSPSENLLRIWLFTPRFIPCMDEGEWLPSAPSKLCRICAIKDLCKDIAEGKWAVQNL